MKNSLRTKLSVITFNSDVALASGVHSATALAICPIHFITQLCANTHPQHFLKRC